MTAQLLIPGPLSALGMPSGTVLMCKVRAGAVKLKVFGLYGVQACAFVISLPVSPFLAIFRHVSTKFFSPGPKLGLVMPSNSTWMWPSTMNWVASGFSWQLWVGTGAEVAKSGLGRQNYANQQMFQSLDSSSQVSWALTPSTSLPYLCWATVSFILL